MGQPRCHHQPPRYQTGKSLKILKAVLGQHPQILRETEGSHRIFAPCGMPVKLDWPHTGRLERISWLFAEVVLIQNSQVKSELPGFKLAVFGTTT